MTVNLSRTRITVGGLTFGIEDDDGTQWIWDKWTGWTDGAPSRSSMADREGSHGATPGDLYYGRRTITFSGRVGCEDRRTAAQSAERLAGILGDGGYHPFEVIDDDLGYRRATVQRGADIKVDWVGGLHFVDYQITVVSPDHRRYGPSRTYRTGVAPQDIGGLDDEGGIDQVLDTGEIDSPSTIQITNNGSADADPLLRLRGGTTGIPGPITIVEGRSGRRLIYTGSIDPGHYIDFDAGPARAVLYDGYASRRELLVRAEWPTIPARGSTGFTWEHGAGHAGDGELEIVAADAIL